MEMKNMEYTILKLTELMNRLDIAYDKFVVAGGVDIESEHAKSNRNKSSELKKAIEKLESETSEQPVVYAPVGF